MKILAVTIAILTTLVFSFFAMVDEVIPRTELECVCREKN